MLPIRCCRGGAGVGVGVGGEIIVGSGRSIGDRKISEQGWDGGVLAG